MQKSSSCCLWGEIMRVRSSFGLMTLIAILITFMTGCTATSDSQQDGGGSPSTPAAYETPKSFSPDALTIESDVVTTDASGNTVNPHFVLDKTHLLGLTETSLVSIDLLTGDSEWAYEFDNTGVSGLGLLYDNWTPKVSQGVVYAARHDVAEGSGTTGDNEVASVVAVEIETGKKLWSASTPMIGEAAVRGSRNLTDARVVSVNDELLLVEAGSGLVAFDPSSGKILWKVDNVNALATSQTVVAWDGSAWSPVGLDPASGTKRWTSGDCKGDTPVSNGAAVTLPDGRVVARLGSVSDETAGCFIDPTSGKPSGNLSISAGGLTVNGSVVYAGAQPMTTKVTAYDASSLKQLWTLPTDTSKAVINAIPFGTAVYTTVEGPEGVVMDARTGKDIAVPFKGVIAGVNEYGALVYQDETLSFYRATG